MFRVCAEAVPASIPAMRQTVIRHSISGRLFRMQRTIRLASRGCHGAFRTRPPPLPFVSLAIGPLDGRNGSIHRLRDHRCRMLRRCVLRAACEDGYPQPAGGSRRLIWPAHCCCLISLYDAWNLPSVVIETFWAAISLYGMIRNRRH